MKQNSVIILGAGWSVNEGIAAGLWEKIKGRDVWSCNSCFKAMPRLPTRQVWVDKEFFKHEIDNLQRLWQQKVELISKNDIKFAGLAKEITQYNTTRLRQEYYGKQAIEKKLVFYGEMGLCGAFALSVAIARGYNEIFLLGFDFGSPTLGQLNTHWYQQRIPELDIRSGGAGRPEVYLHKEPEMKGQPRRVDLEDWEVYSKEKDIAIWNVSTISHLPYFPKISYEEFFAKL